MASNNALAQRKPQPSADPRRFCRKERFKDLGLELRGDPWTRVNNLKPNLMQRRIILGRNGNLVWR